MYLIHVSLHTKTATIKKHFRFWTSEQGYLCLSYIGLETSIFDSTNMAWITEEYTRVTRNCTC